MDDSNDRDSVPGLLRDIRLGMRGGRWHSSGWEVRVFQH